GVGWNNRSAGIGHHYHHDYLEAPVVDDHPGVVFENRVRRGSERTSRLTSLQTLSTSAGFGSGRGLDELQVTIIVHSLEGGSSHSPLCAELGLATDQSAWRLPSVSSLPGGPRQHVSPSPAVHLLLDTAPSGPPLRAHRRSVRYPDWHT